MESMIYTLDKIHLVAKELLSYIKEGKHILLEGGLGAGKTTLTASIIRLLSDEEVEVSSPTYAVVQEYETNIGIISHLDLYRIKDEIELLDIGFEDILYQGLCIIEWPEIGMNFIENAVKINIETINDAERKYEFTFID